MSSEQDRPGDRTSSYIDMVKGQQVKPAEGVSTSGSGTQLAGPVPVVSKSVGWDKMHVVDNLKEYQGSDVAAKIEDMVKKHKVVIFSKSHCPFCLEAKSTFKSLNIPITVLEVNRSDDGSAIRSAIKAKYQHSTVPVIFIKGEFIGGCDDLKTLQNNLELDSKVADLIVREKESSQHNCRLETIEGAKSPRGSAVQPLFWFPNVVDNHVVRLSGFFTVVSCIVGIIFREDEEMHWYITFLALDYLFRMMFGSPGSPLGMIATFICSFFKPKFRSGPPKQFAASCGFMFSVTAMGFYHGGYYITGACVLGGLLGAASLEAFLDFCLGCLFYSWGIRFGLIPPTVYRIYANTKDMVVNGWEYANVEANKSSPPSEFVHAGDKSRADLKYKRVKSDEHILTDFNIVRNMQVTYFSMPLALAGLATAFKLSSSWLQDFVAERTGSTSTNLVFRYEIQHDIWRTFATIAGVVYMLMLVLYITRLVFFPKKCIKEWHCPMRSPAFGMITITCTLLSFLCYDQFDDAHFGRGLWWISSVTHTLLTITKFGEWIGKRYELEHVHPSWLILPVGGFVSAMIAPIVPAIVEDDGTREIQLSSSQNIEIANFYYSFAYLMWIALFTITFFKVVTTHNSDDRIRSQVFIWIAPPAVASLAEFIICFHRTLGPAVDLGECYNNFSQLYWIAIMLELGLIWAWMPYINFFGRNKFNMSYWNYVFSLDVVAAASVVFLGMTQYKIAEWMFAINMSAATAANFLAFVHFLTALVRKRGVFTPEIKWGPLSFMKLVHEGVRGAVPKMTKCLEALDINNKDSFRDFAVEVAKFSTLHHEHAAHEDKVVFREFERYFPDHASKYLDDHEQDRVFLADIHTKIDKVLAFCGSEDGCINADEATSLIAEFQEKLPPFMESFALHLAGEEANLNPIGRKHIPLAVQKELVKRVWDLTPTKNWAVIIPYVLENLPRLPMRARFVKALCWGLGGERAQQIGYIIYKNCDAVMWEVIVQDVPEIIPRGVSGWRRYY